MGMMQHAPMGWMVPMRFLRWYRAAVARLGSQARVRAPLRAGAAASPTLAPVEAGRLAGGLAHDLNNILLVIQGYAEIAMIDEDAGPVARAHILELRKALARAAGLVDDLRLIGQGGPFDPREIDLNEAIARSLPALREEAGERIDVRFEPSGAPLRAVVDERHLERMLRALCARGRTAMPEGGTLTVRCEGAPGGAAGAATITVLDTGIAAPPEARSRLFEPYPPGPGAKGQGLGLAVARAIAERMGGTIRADASAEGGTAIVVTIPVASSARRTDRESDISGRTPKDPLAQPAGHSGANAAPDARTASILLADDDESTRALGARILAQEGYRVLCARDGLEAVEIFSANRDTVGLVVLDDVMPRLSGRGALKRIRQLAPDVPALLVCGYAWSLDGKGQPGVEACDLLQKPWQPRDLLRSVRARLEPSA